MRVLFATVFTAILMGATFNTTWADDAAQGPVRYANGDVGRAMDRCAPGQLCAMITLANGDNIKVLSGGSGTCNPYIMTFMRYHKKQIDSVWSTPTDRYPDNPNSIRSSCGGFRNTRMKILDGPIDMGIFQNRDGSLFVKFFGGNPPAN